VAAGDDFRVPGGGAFIEGKNPAAEVFGQDAVHHRGQLSLALTVGKPRDTVMQLGGSDRGRGHLGDFKGVKPGEHSGIWRLAGQFGDDVGVEDDQRSNSAAGCGSPPRAGSSRSFWVTWTG
jgi:hypothetical protein